MGMATTHRDFSFKEHSPMANNDVTKMAFFAPDPKLMTVDFNQIEQKAKEIRKARDAQPVRSEGPAGELARLRNELFLLEQRAKHTEVYTNNKAGEVKLLEQQLISVLKQKKNYGDNGNLLAARNCEHQIERLEDERDVAAREFERARKQSAGAAIVLKEWPHHERLKELQKIVA
jgi:hypothetical protein